MYKIKLRASCLDICGGNGNLSWELLKPKEASEPNDVPSDARQRLKCVIVDPKSVQFSHQKSKLIWQLYSKSTSNSKQNIFNTDGTGGTGTGT